MECPNCHTKLEYVNVYSQCVQKADVDDKGIITDYGFVDEVMETLDIECPRCSKSIRKLIKET